MNVDNVCERIKIWSGRGIAQQITLHISKDGEIQVDRFAKIKNDNDLETEGIGKDEIALLKEIS